MVCIPSVNRDPLHSTWSPPEIDLCAERGGRRIQERWGREVPCPPSHKVFAKHAYLWPACWWKCFLNIIWTPRLGPLSFQLCADGHLSSSPVDSLCLMKPLEAATCVGKAWFGIQLSYNMQTCPRQPIFLPKHMKTKVSNESSSSPRTLCRGDISGHILALESPSWWINHVLHGCMCERRSHMPCISHACARCMRWLRDRDWLPAPGVREQYL